ncbi:MAG TPA: hypothetical protein VNZ53_00950 [Steroidobacteraceae bacterium]|nr:hypothetical protein [Steroidobacteraceae bacterium]
MGTTDLLLTRLERELRPIARERIAKGQLPREAFTRFWGAFGTGQPCSLCDERIQSDEIEYDVPIEAVAQGLRFHRVCHYAWQLECDRLKRRPRGIPINPH